ncbi:MAG: hypothetical protein ACXAC8_06385 [Candidatus Hodarchaeales archaeon]|jgi:hypothetical protein
MTNENKSETPESFESLMKSCMESMGDMGDFFQNMQKTMESCFSSLSKEGGNMVDFCQRMFQGQPKKE